MNRAWNAFLMKTRKRLKRFPLRFIRTDLRSGFSIMTRIIPIFGYESRLSHYEMPPVHPRSSEDVGRELGRRFRGLDSLDTGLDVEASGLVGIHRVESTFTKNLS